MRDTFVNLKTKNYNRNPITNTWKHLDMYSIQGRSGHSHLNACNAYLAWSIASRLSKNVFATTFLDFSVILAEIRANAAFQLFPREIRDWLHKVQESGHDEEVFKRFKETWWKWGWERALSFVSTHTMILQNSKIAASEFRLTSRFRF